MQYSNRQYIDAVHDTGISRATVRQGFGQAVTLSCAVQQYCQALRCHTVHTNQTAQHICIAGQYSIAVRTGSHPSHLSAASLSAAPAFAAFARSRLSGARSTRSSTDRCCCCWLAPPPPLLGPGCGKEGRLGMCGWFIGLCIFKWCAMLTHCRSLLSQRPHIKQPTANEEDSNARSDTTPYSPAAPSTSMASGPPAAPVPSAAPSASSASPGR